jgi:hypothetical protein
MADGFNGLGGGWNVPGEDTAEHLLGQLISAGELSGEGIVAAINAKFPERGCAYYAQKAEPIGGGNGPFYALGPGSGLKHDYAALNPDVSPMVWDLIGFGPGGSDSGATTGGTTFAYPKGLVVAQCGLLEDDILYRMALLATNVLEPLKAQYPGIVVVGGFRRVNTGVGQHELGEAVDLQIRNQTPELLYEVADYINKNLNFDDLILNWTTVGDGQGWIHVSFSPTSLRGLAQTKDLADAFHDGLFIVEPQTGEAAAQARRDNEAAVAAITGELTIQQSRQERLTPKTAEEASGSDAEGATSGGAAGVPAFEPPDMRQYVNDLFDQGTWDFRQGDEFDQESPVGRGAFTEALCAILHGIDPNWGHIRKNPGQKQYNGHAIDFIQYKNEELGAAAGVDIAGSVPHWILFPGDINKWYF